MRVLVCGGRNYGDRIEVFSQLDLRRPAVVIQGGANGADRIAREWADQNGCPCITYHAAWKTLRNTAGPFRNAFMLKDSRPDLVLAFPGGRGTADMVRRARAAGVEVIEVE